MRNTADPDTAHRSLQKKIGRYTSSRLSSPKPQGKHEELRLSDPFFRQIINNLEDYAVFTTDRNGNVSSWNSGAKRLLGFNKNEIIGQNADILYVAADRKAKVPKKDLQTAINQGKSVDEKWHVRKNGSSLWVSCRVFPLTDERGRVLGFTKIVRNLTGQKQLEDTMAQTQLQNEVFSAGLMGAWTLDFKTNLAVTSPSIARLYGVDPQKALAGLPLEMFMDAIHPDDREQVLAHIAHAIKTGEPYEVDYRTIGADKKERWVLERGKKASATRLAGVLIEITERKHFEQQKDDFMGIVSHELKTPVTSIKAFTQVLQGRFAKAGDKESTILLGKMDAQINRLTALIGDLLDVTKIEGGKLQFNEGYFPFDELVNEIVEEVQRTTTKHKIKVGGRTGKTIYGDRDRIGQVIVNLLTNAIKYSPYADKVIVKVSATKQSVMLCVHDFGAGIPKEKQPKIFQRFYRVSEAAYKTISGIGLGLYISSEIIKRQKGKIWVESQQKKGSIFCFRLPLRKRAIKQ